MKSKPNPWSAFESMSGGAVMAEWARARGGNAEGIRFLLRPTTRVAATYPCTNRFPCGCQHRLERDRRNKLVAICDCGECNRIELDDGDAVVFEPDVHKLGETLVKLCRWATVPVSRIAAKTWVVGSIGPERRAVVLWLGAEEVQLRTSIDRLVLAGIAPFVLLTLTSRALSHHVDALLKREGSVAVAVSDLVEVSESGSLALKGSPDGILKEMDARSATSRQTGELLQGISRKIDGVTAEYQDLRRAKEELEKMRTEGLFKFTERIDADSFKVFCAILAHGDVAKASRALNEKDSTIRTRVASWKTRGPAYKILGELVRWRKQIGRREPTQLSEDVLGGRAASTDYPGLLSDVLDELVSVDDTNWEEKCSSLADLLRPYVPR